MLYFTPVENFGSSNPIIQMVWDEFELPLTEETKHLALFNIRTFSALTSKKKESLNAAGELTVGPEVAYDPVNDFLSKLTLEEQQKIAIALIHAHLEIQDGNPDASDIEQVEDRVATILDDLDKDIDLCPKTEDYIRNSNIPLADMSDAGTRPQDSPEMTFHEEEAIIITAITVFMKLVSPLMGAFIHKYSGVIDNEFKETHARAMLTKLHNRRYSELLLKLHFYLTRLVDGKLKVDATAMYNGNTLYRAARHAVDMAIIKRLVSVSLHKRDGNIIKYLASCGRGSTESQQKNIASNNAAKIIADPVDQDRDEGNTSRLEVESSQSVKTADVPILLTVAADKLWKQIVELEELDMEAVEAARAYYRRSPIVVNIISQYLLCMYYGPALGGGNGILYLNSTTISDLSATLQVLFTSRGAPVLGHVVSISVSESPRIPQKEDYIFTNGWTSTPEYTECRKLLPAGFGDREWNSRLKDIASFLMQHSLVYNTAPGIWDLVNESPRNGKIFTDYMPLMISLMKFVSMTYARGKND